MMDLFVRKIPTSQHYFEQNQTNVLLPYHRPRDVLQYLLATEPWILLGGLKPGLQAQQMLQTFWDAFKYEHASHEVYSTPGIDFKFTIPLLLHGDGARTLKKQPLEVVSLQPVLGIDTIQASRKCGCDVPTVYSGEDLSDPRCLRLNSKNNSYLTHFLLCSFPSKRYKKLPGLLKAMLECICQDLATVCSAGLVHDDNVYKFAVIGCKGDLEYQKKIGVLNRSYMNVGHRNQNKVCHECWGGDPAYPFEDFRSTANWRTSLYNDTPWETPPPFRFLAFEPWNSGKAAMFFKRDPLHIFRLGVARNLCGSAVVLCCLEGLFDDGDDSKAMENRLARAWSLFTLWCESENVSPQSMRAFTKEKLHYMTQNSFPWIGCKGSDTMLLLRWLRWFSSFQLGLHPGSEILAKLVKACQSGIDFQRIHRHGIFLWPQCRLQIMYSCRNFCHAYAELASLCFRSGRTLFGMVPKAHALAHIDHYLQDARNAGDPISVNPALYDCSMSEDFVGQVARQSRRVSYKKTVDNTLLAYRVRAKMVIQRFKKQRGLWPWTLSYQKVMWHDVHDKIQHYATCVIAVLLQRVSTACAMRLSPSTLNPAVKKRCSEFLAQLSSGKAPPNNGIQLKQILCIVCIDVFCHLSIWLSFATILLSMDIYGWYMSWM